MENILTRKAVAQDKKIVWEWWNDQLTRKMMKLNEYVPWENHTKWFDNTINSDTRVLLVSIVEDKKIGVVRFDLKSKDIYEVSINLNPDFRGQGYGSKILQSSLKFFLETNTETKKFFAMFKKINISSKKTFLKNGFVIIKSPDKSSIGLERFDAETEEYCELLNNKDKEY